MKIDLLPASLVAAAALLNAGTAAAQEFPNRTITVVWPFTAGSAGETFMRAVSQDASKVLGRPVIVEARAGGGGRVALNSVLNGDRDGHLLGLFNAGPLVIQPLAGPEPRITPGKSYAPITVLFDVNQALYVRVGLPFSDLKGLIAHAKANPGKLNYGSTGVGSVSHLATELLKSLTGIELTHIPYKGAAAAVPALLTGEIDLLFTAAEPKTYVAAGKLIVLGTTSTQWWSAFPDQRPISETVPGFGYPSWYGLIAPAGVPAANIAKVYDAFTTALKNSGTNPVVQKTAATMGADLVLGRTPEQFTKIIIEDLKRLEPVVRKAGITVGG